MKKGKVARIAGFVGALGLSAVLVATAVQGTGAYFSSTVPGSLSSSSGQLVVSASPTTLDYADLMPGANIDKTINYSVSVSSGGVDVWLVFDKNTAGYQGFTGGSGSANYPSGGLGRYGYFNVSDSHGGQAFQSGNLSFSNGANVNSGTAADCTVNAVGRGGSTWIATQADPHATQYCGVPAAILLASNLTDTANGVVTVTFGLNGWLQTAQNQTEPTVNFAIVGTQHGQSPTT